MTTFNLPYGKSSLTFTLPEGFVAKTLEPKDVPAATDPVSRVEKALSKPVGGVELSQFHNARTVSIAVNDKTRPVPHQHLLPPLLKRLEALGIPPTAIQLFIATGTHPFMPPEEYPRILPAEVINRYSITCHEADDHNNLVHLGTTARGTPVWVNKSYLEADLRVVVGNIGPHQFQGFSGGVKSAAIGLAGRETINHNHAMMTDPKAQVGWYKDNPPRQDIEEIGQKIGVHFALNAILNSQKEIVHALAGDPRAIMEVGIPLAREVYLVEVDTQYDFVIASPGGYPKDLNLYQTQKALGHASLITRDGGVIIITAACPEGSGSQSYESWMEGVHSIAEVFSRFQQEGFRVGPHKAFQIARDADRVNVFLVSDLSPEFTRRMLLTPASSVEEAFSLARKDLPPTPRGAVMPQATSTIPYLNN
jgi:nickel-dependent lactate racemase